MKKLDASTVKFVFDGMVIKPASTPKMLAMDDDDLVDCT